jgi:hypothetical protein
LLVIDIHLVLIGGLERGIAHMHRHRLDLRPADLLPIPSSSSLNAVCIFSIARSWRRVTVVCPSSFVEGVGLIVVSG